MFLSYREAVLLLIILELIRVSFVANVESFHTPQAMSAGEGFLVTQQC